MPASVRALARGGAIAGIIKLTSAGLSFFMFLTLALVTDQREFGLFSAAYAGASLVSFFAPVGQQSAVLRFWPQYVGADKPGKAQSFMARSIWVTLIGLLVTTVAVAGLGLVPMLGQGMPEWLGLCLATSALSFALGWSEFASGAMRAKNVLIGGLLPRDVIWRALVIVITLVLFIRHEHIPAVVATLLCAVTLIAAVAPQAVLLIRETVGAQKEPLSRQEKQEFNEVTLGLWGVTSLPPALGQTSTLIVASLLGAEVAGAVFVADRTTRLVNLGLVGINQALAPEISNAFHNGRLAYVQRIVSLTAVASTVLALLTTLAFWLFGDVILGVFDPAYANPTIVAVLIILALGVTVASACGPIEVVMQLTGAQNALLGIVLSINLVGLGVTALLAYGFGPIGAAIGIAGTVATWCIAAVVAAKRRVHINTSVLGIFA